MGDIFQILGFAMVGFVIAGLCFWWIDTAIAMLKSDKNAIVLGEIQVVGSSDDKKDKAVLPQLVVAQTKQVNTSLSQSFELLSEIARDSGHDPNIMRFNSPDAILAGGEPVPIDLELSVGGVDWGPLIKFVSDRFKKKQNLLDITISHQSDAENKIIYGHFSAKGNQGFTFKTQTDGGLDAVAETIAFSLVKERTQRQGNEIISTLTHDDYGTIMKAMMDYVEIEKMSQYGLPDDDVKASITEKIIILSDKYNKWRPLQALALKLSEDQKNWVAAKRNLEYLLLTETEPKKIDKIKGDIRLVEDIIAGKKLPKDYLSTVALTEQNTVKIDIVGDNPTAQEHLVAKQSSEIDTSKLSSIQKYSLNLALTIGATVPDAILSFSPSPYMDNTSSNSDELQKLITKSEIDIVVYTYSGQSLPSVKNPLQDAIGKVLVDIANSGKIVIVAAGNKPELKPAFYEHRDVLFIASATDENGQQAYYAPPQPLNLNQDVANELFWMPGISADPDTPMFGTTFSAANLATVIAGILNSNPNATNHDIRLALNNTKTEVSDEIPPKLNIEKAKEWLDTNR